MNIYCIKFEHPDHGYYYRYVRTTGELDIYSRCDKDLIKEKLGIYNTIVDIEPILVGETITRI